MGLTLRIATGGISHETAFAVVELLRVALPALGSAVSVVAGAVETRHGEELGALGAAIIAAVGAGLYPDLETAVGAMTRIRDRIWSMCPHR